MLESLFDKVADLKGYNFIKRRPQHRCFPVNIVNFFGDYLAKQIFHVALLERNENYKN